MLQTKPFTRRILLLGVLPVCVAIALLACGFVLVQRHQIQVLEKQVSAIIESSLLPLLKNANSASAEFAQTVRLLLNIESVSHISIYDRTSDQSTDFALPLKDRQGLTFSAQEKASTVVGNTVYTTLPVSAPDGAQWLVIGVQSSPLIVLRYKGYLILLAVAIVALLLTLHFASRLYNAVTAPLINILSDLRQTLTNASDKPLSHSKNHLYNELVGTLNEMISLQQSIRDEMQNNVDQSTKELRETLETVEIQNIELDFARKNALQASRAKSEFLANTSHELRTPLNGILGFTSLLLKTGLTNQQKDYLTTIEQSAQGLLTVISDILDFSKLETGQLTLEYKPIFVRELIEEVFAIYAPQAHEKNMRLLAIINHNVPRNLLGDPQRLKQVITNLISNAIKFSSHGNVVVRATSLGETDNQIEIKFSVTDNGIGVTEEQQENLFSAFTKVDSSDSRFQGGTGLGLAIAKGLVDRMSGEIGVDSEVQRGSTFWFTVRLGMDRLRISQSPFVNSLYGLHVLVFDCNPVCRMEITHLLTNWGVKHTEETHFNNIQNTIAARATGSAIELLILDAYTEEASFERERLLKGIQRIKTTFKLPVIVLAPPAIQRVLQDDIIALNSLIVPRPVVHSALHQAMCTLLNVAQRLSPSVESASNNPSGLKNKGVRVLVVDDNPANIKLVCEFLKALGVDAKSTNSGYEAIEICAKESFNLIFMDVQMPGMDGLETTKLLRSKETDRRTPIVALTAHAVNEQKTQLLLAGMDDFLSKPVSEEDLRHIIERWVKPETAAPDNSATRIVIQTSAAAGGTATMEQSKTAPGDDEAPSRFNWSESLRLAKNKPDLATDMLKMLLASLDETEDRLKQALSDQDMKALLEVTHKFHGGCCYCGVPAAREASKKLEEVLHRCEYGNLEVLANDLLAEITALKAWEADHDIDILFDDLDD